MSESYVSVTATLLARSPKAALLKNDEGQGWVARSCIHGADEGGINAADIGDEITLRMFEWVANDKGLL